MIKFIINETRNTIMILSLYFLPLILQEFMIMIMIFDLHLENFFPASFFSFLYYFYSSQV